MEIVLDNEAGFDICCPRPNPLTFLGLQYYLLSMGVWDLVISKVFSRRNPGLSGRISRLASLYLFYNEIFNFMGM